MRLPKDILQQTYTKPRIFLCETDKTKICELKTTDTSGSFKFNAYSELEFTVGRTYDDMMVGATIVNPYYDKIEALRLIHLEGFGYFEIQDPEIVSNGIREVKNVTAYSLEYTLSQKYLENFLINTGEIGSVEVTYAEKNNTGIEPVTLYNPTNTELSLLHLALEKVYGGWKIAHVDTSLRTMSRTFEVSRASIYDFLTQDVCEKFNCYMVFDTIDNTISIYAESPITKFIGDGIKKSFIVSPVYDGLDFVSIDGYKTTAYTYNNITGELIFNVAPESGAKIEVVDGSQKAWATDVYVSFDNLAQEVNISYSADDIKTVLTVKGADNLDIREVNFGLPYITDLSYYYTPSWMGQDLYDAYTTYLQKSAERQDEYTENSKQLLEINNYVWHETNRLSLQYSIADSVNSSTVGKYYVRGGTAPNYYYTEVSLPTEYSAEVEHYYTLSGNDLNETKFTKFYEAIKKYYKDKVIDDLSELKEDFAFIEKYSIDNLVTDLSNAITTEQKDVAVTKFLDLLWEQLGKTPLTELYYEPYKKVQATNIEDGWDKESHDYYWYYYPVIVVLKSIENAQKIRQDKIDEYEIQKEAYQTINDNIANALLISNPDNFTPKQLIRLNAFLREDEYTDDNFVETESDTIETLMKTKQELLECGRIELSKLCEPKLAFSMDMANIYALPEFEPIVYQFQLGKLINVEIRSDYIKRARLLEVNINFDDFSDFTCEFGELTNLRTPSSIHADLLASALSAGKTVASNASYWNKGADLATNTDIKIQQGLIGAVDGLYTSDQSVTINNNGILLRKLNEDGSFSPYQTWLTSNNILISSDSFASARTGIGEFTIDGVTHYGVLADAIFSGYIEGSDIVGGTINIGNGTFMVDQFGNVTMKSVNMEGTVNPNQIISTINMSPENIAISSEKISLVGKNIDMTTDEITISSNNFSVTKDGNITAIGGTIGGWTIYPTLLRKETTVDDIDYQIYLQPADGVSTSNAFAVRKKNTTDADWDIQFAVNYAGKMTAKNANVTGSITAESGSIAGYNIGAGGSYGNALYKRIIGDSARYEVGMKATDGDTDLAFYVKESIDNWETSSNNFYINNIGKLYAKNADITGKITASSGSISSWNIGDMGGYTDSIYATYCAADTPSSSNPEYAVFMRGKGSSASTIAIGVKKRTSSSTSWNDADNPFYVRKDGYLVATNANITGTVNASSGSIGGFDIANNYLRTDITVSGTRYQTFLQSADGSSTTTAFAVRNSTNDGSSWTYQFRVNYDGSAVMRNATITGTSTIDSACIGNLNASKITAGTFSADRIPNLSASKITSGTISTARLDASVITTGNFSSKSLSTGNLSVTNGASIGNWSVSGNNLYAISGSVGTSLTAYGVSTGSTGSISASWTSIAMAGEAMSDIRLKSDVCELNDKFDNMFDSLRPVQYRYKDGCGSNGTHFGFIAQDVLETMNENGISDFAGVYEDAASEINYYHLQKQELIALNTWQIQKLKTRIEELENRIDALERK